MKHYLDEIPLYMSGGLDEQTREALEEHIARCTSCREDLSFWQATANVIRQDDAGVTPPEEFPAAALERIHALEEEHLEGRSLRRSLLGAFNLLKAQAFMIRREMWPAVAAVMGLSVIVALISKQYGVIAFVGPLVAAASLAGMSGPGKDPAYELTMATPTSAWKILLARLSVASAYNLVIALLASVAMLLIIPADLLGLFILGWFAPMAFLSSLALFLSVWIGTNNAIVMTYGMWLLQYFRISVVFNDVTGVPVWDAFLLAYQKFWESPAILLAFATLMLAATLFSARYTDRGLAQFQV